jgi:hypothetical protein
MDYNRPSWDLDAIAVSALAAGFVPGTVLPYRTAAQNSAVGSFAGVAFPVPAGTYRFCLGSSTGDTPTPAQTSLISVQLAWQAAVAGTITLKTTNFQGFLGGDKSGRGGVDVSDFDTTFWVPHTPSSGFYVPVTGSGNSVSGTMVVTMGGSAIGNAIFELGNIGDRRVAFELVLTVGGVVRCTPCGKLGA